MSEHYDLDAAEKYMRANVATANEERSELVRMGQADSQFIAAQRCFDEARVQTVLGMLRAANMGLDRNAILAAAGYATGSTWASVLEGCIGARERGLVNGWVQNALTQAIGEQAAGKTMRSVIEPMVAGHA